MLQKLIELLVQSLTARLTQMLSRPAMAAAAVVGADQLHASNAVNALVAGVVAVVLFVFDLVVHSKRMETARQMLGDLYDRTPFSGDAPLDVKKVLPMFLLVGLLMGVGRCASTASPQVQAAR